MNLLKNIFLTVLVAFSSQLYLQELDENYLESLPEDIREDVLKEIKSKEALDTVSNYRRPSTFVQKKIDNVTKDISLRFGEEFFDQVQTSFMPVNEPNFDEDYILDFGDVLEVQIIGQDSEIYELDIKRDGSINIPNYNKIFISGLSLLAAEELIKNNINAKIPGSDSYISLINIRDIQVMITGNAYNPGIYTLNGNSNLLHAIYMSGGLNESGSYRSIEHRRNGKTLVEFDLYELFIFGNYPVLKRLRSGDTVHVNKAIKNISIFGGVKRESIYELKVNETVKDIINFANGFKPNARLNSIAIETYKNGRVFRTTEIFENLKDNNLEDGDYIYVGQYKKSSVTIEGAVQNPGVYGIEPGETLSSLIERQGGYSENAYPFAGALYSKKAIDVEDEVKSKDYDTLLKYLSTKSTQGNGPSIGNNASTLDLLEQIKNSQSFGRIEAEFNMSMIKRNSSLDTNLNDGDIIFIPYVTDQVFVFGEVEFPGAVRYRSGLSADDYINLKGGTSKYSSNQIIHVSPNGKSQIVEPTIFISDNSIAIYPGSLIYVPKNYEKVSNLTAAQAIAPLISNTALALASIAAFNNN